MMLIVIKNKNFFVKEVYLGDIKLNLIIQRTYLFGIWNLYNIEHNNKIFIKRGNIKILIKYIDENKSTIAGFSKKEEEKNDIESIKSLNKEALDIIQTNFLNIKYRYLILALIIVTIIVLIVFLLSK